MTPNYGSAGSSFLVVLAWAGITRLSLRDQARSRSRPSQTAVDQVPGRSESPGWVCARPLLRRTPRTPAGSMGPFDRAPGDPGALAAAGHRPGTDAAWRGSCGPRRHHRSARARQRSLSLASAASRTARALDCCRLGGVVGARGNRHAEPVESPKVLDHELARLSRRRVRGPSVSERVVIGGVEFHLAGEERRRKGCLRRKRH